MLLMSQAEFFEGQNKWRAEEGLQPYTKEEEVTVYARYVREHPKVHMVHAALGTLADLADLLEQEQNTEERTKLVQLMQQLENLYDFYGCREIEAWLKECHQPA